MTEPGPTITVVLAVLATWRITHLIAREDGPFDLLIRFRTRLGDGVLGHMLDCFYCLTIWTASVVAWMAVGFGPYFFVIWFGLSGAACLIDRFVRGPVFIYPDSDQQKIT